jgi:F-type H+/Na+-transporting ATPase subunit alpha
LDEKTKKQIDRGQRIVKLFKQGQYTPLALEVEVSLLFAMQNGFFDDVPVAKVKDCQAKMQEYLTTRKDALLLKISEEKALSDEILADLKQALTDFKSNYQP